MSGIDETIPFAAINIAVMTVSDTRTEDTDRSGATLVERLEKAGHRLADKRIVPDERAAIEAQLRQWIADPEVDAVIATGGTGVTGRDVTPEAFEAVFEKEIPGFGELFRMISFDKIGSSTIQSRAMAGGGGRHLPVRRAGLDRRLPRRLGRDPGLPARRPAQALQLRRADAAAQRAPRGAFRLIRHLA